MITIDGSRGEGGGQVLRTALSLSLVTGQPFQISAIRAGRKNPGLMKQHLAAVRAAATVGSATVRGDALGSGELTFFPGSPRGGHFTFSVKSAGSATLVLQTVLPALLAASEPATVTLEGGTHNPAAPPFDALVDAFLPLVRRMGVDVSASIEARGFYPAGGGRFTCVVRPGAFVSLELDARGPFVGRSVRAIVSRIPEHVGARELEAMRRALDLGSDADLEVSEAPSSPGPGNALVVTLRYANVTEVFTGFGERGKRAETVAEELAREVNAYLASLAPVGPHLADQLVLPMLVTAGGRFRTGEPSTHLQTQLETVRAFADGHVSLEAIEDGLFEVRVRPLELGAKSPE